ncbi:MAG: hypothetical protein ABL929_05320, partial [Ferruginibacter sp.]
ISFYCACNTTKSANITANNTIALQDSNRLSSYKGDTIGYINYIYKNQAKYIGKPLSILLNDLDLKVYQFGYNGPHKRDGKIYSISLNTNAYGNHVRVDKFGNDQEIELGVGFQQYVLHDSIKEIRKLNGTPNYGNWSKKAEEYFGKQIISNLWLYNYMNRSK